MMKRVVLALLIFLTAALSGCSNREHHSDPHHVSVGTISGPETKLMEVAKKVALKKYGLHVKIVEFSNYAMPNQALADHQIDANAFQHYPFLLTQMRMHGYPFVVAGKTFLYPMGLYSRKVNKLSELKPGAEIAIPNDPSNEARALLLLQKAGLIELDANAGVNTTISDIKSNPEKFKLVSLDAAQLPRVLDDVALAAINTNYAIPAGLSPAKNALLAETTDSPYVNLIVTRHGLRDSTKIKQLVEAYQSEPVVEEAKKLFGDGAVPGFKVAGQ